MDILADAVILPSTGPRLLHLVAFHPVHLVLSMVCTRSPDFQKKGSGIEVELKGSGIEVTAASCLQSLREVSVLCHP